MLALLLALPSAALALGLGDVRLLSPLNAPLKAEVELVDVAPDEFNTIQAQIASRDTFARYGLDYPGYLSNVIVRTVNQGDGRAVVSLRSNEPITDPFITLLIEVNWSRGHLVREYTLLLDPPVYAPSTSAVAAAPTTAPTTGMGAREGTIARAAEHPTAAPSPPPPPPPPAPKVAPPAKAPSAETSGERLVQRGDTLSGIASEVAGSSPNAAQTRSWILAIYQANPHAFDKNMNWLHAGAVLRIPDAEQAAAVSPSTASAEIHRQYEAWRDGQGTPAAPRPAAQSGHLRLVTPTESPAAAAAAATAAANAANAAEVNDLKGRVHDLEGQLADSKHQLDDSKRLIEMKDADLARMQAQLAAKQNAPPPPPPQPAVTPPPPPVAQPTAAPPVAQAPAAAEQAPPPPASEEKLPPPPVAAKPAPESKPKPAPAAPSGSLVDTLMQYWWALLVLLGVVLAFIILRLVRARRASEFDSSLDRLTAASEEVEFHPEPEREPEPAPVTPPLRAAAPAPAPEPPPMRATAPAPDTGFLVEESGLHPRLSGGASPGAPAAKHVTGDETISSETAIHLDQGDPLAEADFHMAYGLYDQAADLIRIAIAREPERRDLRLKLLEVFFVWGNKEQFLQTARELAGTRAEAAPGEWEKILIMGKQLAPEDPMFSGAAPAGGALAGGVDLDLEGGQSRVDFDLLGEPVPGGGGAVDLDVGAAPIEHAFDSPTQATDRNAALLERTFSSTTGTTRQMTQKIRPDPTGATAEMEGPTVEQPNLANKDSTTRKRKIESALRQGASEATAELAIDDLGLDIGQADTVDQPGIASAATSTPEAATLVAGVDERSRRVMEEAQLRGKDKGADEEQASTGFWQFDEQDSNTAEGAAPLPDTATTGRLAALGSKGNLEVDVGDATHTLPGAGLDLDVGGPAAANGGGGLDLDVGTSTHPGGKDSPSFIATQRLDAEDLALPDLEPATMSEVGTKLDLARAYMDMGDPDGARNILEEVLNEGSAAQKQEAQRLMESLPG